MVKFFGVVSLIALLSACTSIGVAYKQPIDSEDAAELSGKSIYVHSFNEKGCYSGRTEIKDKIKLHANEEAVVAYSAYAGEDHYFKTQYFCTIFFSFVPEKDAKYRFVGDLVGIPKDMGNYNPRNVGCSAHLIKVGTSGNELPVQLRFLKTKSGGFACIKMVPRED